MSADPVVETPNPATVEAMRAEEWEEGVIGSVTAAAIADRLVAAAVEAERERCLSVIREWVGPDGLAQPWWPNMMAALADLGEGQPEPCRNCGDTGLIGPDDEFGMPCDCPAGVERFGS